jgi:hypothetical protein
VERCLASAFAKLAARQVFAAIKVFRFSGPFRGLAFVVFLSDVSDRDSVWVLRFPARLGLFSSWIFGRHFSGRPGSWFQLVQGRRPGNSRTTVIRRRYSFWLWAADKADVGR